MLYEFYCAYNSRMLVDYVLIAVIKFIGYLFQRHPVYVLHFDYLIIQTFKATNHRYEPLL